jgi:hypothetical protein
MTHYHNIQDTRIRHLNNFDIRLDADYVLYWMQQSQRAEVNHALEYAVLQANHLGMGVVVAFGPRYKSILMIIWSNSSRSMFNIPP